MMHKLFLVLIPFLAFVLNAQETNSTEVNPKAVETVESSVLPSDFFAGALADAQAA